MGREQPGTGHEEDEGDKMVSPGLEEAAPGQAALHEYVRPERRGSRCELHPGKPAGTDEIAEIGEKDSAPGSKLDEEVEVRNMCLWLDLHHLNRARSFAHHSMLDRYGLPVVAEGTSKAGALTGFSRGR
jgi:hypothetical protein